MRLLATVLLAAVIALAGCTGDDGGDGGGTPTDTTTPTDTGTQTPTNTTTETPTQTATQTTAPPRDPVTWDVDVGDNAFAPIELTIQAGDTVRWTQSGSNPHSVTADDGSFDSSPSLCDSFPIIAGCMGQGDTFEQSFDTAGEVGYHCKIHGSPGGGMYGTITVLERYDATP